MTNTKSPQAHNKTKVTIIGSDKFLYMWRRGQVVDTWLPEVSGSSPGCAMSTLSPWERLFTCISSPLSRVKRVPGYRQYARVTRYAMLPRELRKVQWLEWPVGDPME